MFRYSESDEIGDVMYHSEMLQSYETLEEKYPMGAYRFNFETSEGRILNSIVSYKNKSFPEHPVIMFYQDDMRIGINVGVRRRRRSPALKGFANVPLSPAITGNQSV